MNLTYTPGLKEPSVWCNELIEGVLLTPGENNVSEDEAVKLRSHPIYGNYVSLGVITENPKEDEVKKIEPELIKKKPTSPETLINDGKDSDSLSS